MSSARRSKRLGGKAPGPEPPAKRQVRPNPHTLAEFSNTQSPVRHRKVPQKRRPRPIAGTPPPTKRGRAHSTPIKLSSTPTLVPSSPPTYDDSPLPARQKRPQAPPPSSPFDPNCEGKRAHHVVLYTTPVIDGNRKEKDVVINSININDIFRPSLEKL